MSGSGWTTFGMPRLMILARPRRPDWHVCTETIYEAVYVINLGRTEVTESEPPKWQCVPSGVAVFGRPSRVRGAGGRAGRGAQLDLPGPETSALPDPLTRSGFATASSISVRSASVRSSMSVFHPADQAADAGDLVVRRHGLGNGPLYESRWPYGDGWGGRAAGAEIERARFILWWVTSGPEDEIPARFQCEASAQGQATAGAAQPP
jgi:hypothetical protein